MDKYTFEKVTQRVIGVCIRVHKNLGPGWEEVFYQRALAEEMRDNIGFTREVWIPVIYRGVHIGNKRVDFVIENILLEIKAKKELEPRDFTQTLMYLKSSGYKIALLINFGSNKLQIKRFVN